MTNENLKPCETCGQEIAKSAKICPQCGAKNSKSIIFAFFKYWIIIAIIVQIIRTLFPDLLPTLSKNIHNNEVPKCTETDGAIKAFNEAPYQSLTHLKLIFIEKINEISYNPKENIRVCEAVGHLNDTSKRGITYKFEAKENDQYLIYVELN